MQVHDAVIVSSFPLLVLIHRALSSRMLRIIGDDADDIVRKSKSSKARRSGNGG
ncbi:hypothetical protein CBOM_01460 [Ceraceosorus bombacis]|uniref:Uncharacterized protein n=1 Tax=Ceraceosorus bombacis TaxID=401625 RepID=A0A0P1BCU3_9BASI|nr:hypothetical protein CBOM_01460 [Ceraceosorus bombacis]